LAVPMGSLRDNFKQKILCHWPAWLTNIS
jgi:hypothetical protein